MFQLQNAADLPSDARASWPIALALGALDEVVETTDEGGCVGAQPGATRLAIDPDLQQLHDVGRVPHPRGLQLEVHERIDGSDGDLARQRSTRARVPALACYSTCHGQGKSDTR